MQKHNGSVISDGMDSVLVRYHEIALKKGNRAYFTELLKRNLLAAVKDLGAKEIRSLPARLLLTFKNDVPAATLIERMGTVFGVANFSIVERTARDIDALRGRILDSLNGGRFRILSHRNPARRQNFSADFARNQPAARRRRQRKVRRAGRSRRMPNSR